MLTEKERAFLIGLERLTRETGIAIGGCGCCGSPWLTDLQEKELDECAGYGPGENCGDKITWISPNNSYDWENYSKMIVKDYNNRPGGN